MHRKELCSEQLLWRSFINGNMDAYARIYELYARSMYLYGLHFCADPQQVEDAIHDIFVKIHANRTRLPELRNVKLYLLISLKNTLFNHANSKIIRFRIDISACTAALSSHPDAEKTLLDREESEQRQVLVSQIEKRLSPRQKQAVYYRFAEGMQYREIGAMMEINPQSAKNLIQSSIKKIREIYPHLSSALLLLLAL